MAKKAFTLIELLVVIAIIAILAAILFPVFAQAKDAAKKSSSLSNIKQINLCTQMYSGDYDDMVVTNLYIGGDGGWYNWARVSAPYRKNWQIMYSPSGGPKAIASWMNIFTTPNLNWEANWQYFVQYGMNAQYLNKSAPDCSDILVSSGGGTRFFGPPVSNTTPNSPAETIAFTETGQDAPEDNVGTQWVFAPGGFTADDVCTWGDWGPGTGVYWGGFSGNTTTSKMGYFKARHAGGGVVAFLDGHVKYMKPGALAVGTDWNINQAYGTAVINDRNKYLWDIQ